MSINMSLQHQPTDQNICASKYIDAQELVYMRKLYHLPSFEIVRYGQLRMVTPISINQATLAPTEISEHPSSYCCTSTNHAKQTT